jgi:large subunit ribosomal protein L14
MIQQESILYVADNSGAKTVKCIKVLGGYKKKTAKLGGIIVTSVQKLRNKSKITSKVKKGEIYKAFIIRTKKTLKKKDGMCTFSKKLAKNKNAVILLNKKGNPIGTRITEPIPFKLKKKQFIKIFNISPGVI